MSVLTCTLVTPEKLIFSEEADMVVIPGAEGAFGVMAQHMPLISMIRPGVVELHKKTGVEKILVSAGYAETHDSECTILAETAEPVASLTREKVDEELLLARKNLEYAKDEQELKRAEQALLIAQAKQRAI